ncbi:hypothetical protein M0R45_006306 [Rubus argutus]|uniref:Uncharacterized protein n=1 Tax=Rubus argutus TaxID=59490 RepID=A0AAW1YQ64_RUBAR
MAAWKSEALAVESLGAAVRLGLRSTVSGSDKVVARRAGLGGFAENGLGVEVTRARAQVQRNGSPAVLLNWKVMRASCEFGAWGFVGGGAAATMNWTESKSGCD